MSAGIIEYEPKAQTEQKPSLPMTALVNRTFLVNSVEVIPSQKYGEIVRIGVGNLLFRTTGIVLVKKLKDFEAQINAGAKLKVKLVKVKNYYDFTAPDAKLSDLSDLKMPTA